MYFRYFLYYIYVALFLREYNYICIYFIWKHWFRHSFSSFIRFRIDVYIGSAFLHPNFFSSLQPFCLWNIEVFGWRQQKWIPVMDGFRWLVIVVTFHVIFTLKYLFLNCSKLNDHRNIKLCYSELIINCALMKIFMWSLSVRQKKNCRHLIESFTVEFKITTLLKLIPTRDVTSCIILLFIEVHSCVTNDNLHCKRWRALVTFFFNLLKRDQNANHFGVILKLLFPSGRLSCDLFVGISW